MEEKKFITKSSDDTKLRGQDFSKSLKPGDRILLEGELGAGKTTFTQGVANGLSISSRIISPTFVLVRTHEGVLNGDRVNLYHIDLYRIENAAQLETLGLSELFQDNEGIFLIEWGSRHPQLDANWEIKFEKLDENERNIIITKLK